jgi:hypothetical protein
MKLKLLAIATISISTAGCIANPMYEGGPTPLDIINGLASKNQNNNSNNPEAGATSLDASGSQDAGVSQPQPQSVQPAKFPQPSGGGARVNNTPSAKFPQPTPPPAVKKFNAPQQPQPAAGTLKQKQQANPQSKPASFASPCISKKTGKPVNGVAANTKQCADINK